MPITYQADVATFEDVVEVDEAEGLLGWMQRTAAPQVALAACTHLHAANLQVLMAGRPAVVSWPGDDGLADWLRRALAPQEETWQRRS